MEGNDRLGIRVSVFLRQARDGVPSRPWLVAIVFRLAINAAALWLAAEVISGFEIRGIGSLVGTALIFGGVNALIKPVAHVLGCPITCLTAGLFALVINAGMLALTGWIAGIFDLDVSVAWFWPAFWGALLVTIVSALLSAFVGRPEKRS